MRDSQTVGDVERSRLMRDGEFVAVCQDSREQNEAVSAILIVGARMRAERSPTHCGADFV